MRPLLAAVFAIAAFVGPAFAHPSDDWTKVEKIAFESPVRVELWNGNEYFARFHSADAQVIRIKVRDPKQYSLTVRQEIARDQVRLVEKLGGGHADPYPYMRTGQVVGGVGGATALGIAMGRAWPFGVFLGGLTGVMLGTMGGGAVAIVAETNSHRRKIVYISDKPPVSSNGGQPDWSSDLDYWSALR